MTYVKILSFTLLIVFFSSQCFSTENLIAINQIVEHKSLNEVRDGIIDTLNAKYKNNLKYDIATANGNIIIANQIAKKQLIKNPILAISIATPNAQATIKTANNKIPIIFASITDPLGAKLITTLGKRKENVTGVINLPPFEEQIKLLKEVLPKIKSFGVLYNSSESNSIFSVNLLDDLAKKYNVSLIKKPIASSNEIKTAIISMQDKIDAMFLIQDNLVASSISLITKEASIRKIPTIASYDDAVKHGALLSLAYNEYEIGKQVAQIAIQIIDGEFAGNIIVQTPNKLELKVNKNTANQLAIKLPDKFANNQN